MSEETGYKEKTALNQPPSKVHGKGNESPDFRKIHDIPPKELDQIICQFYMLAKKKK